jgi:hypothetical protein
MYVFPPFKQRPCHVNRLVEKYNSKWPKYVHTLMMRAHAQGNNLEMDLCVTAATTQPWLPYLAELTTTEPPQHVLRTLTTQQPSVLCFTCFTYLACFLSFFLLYYWGKEENMFARIKGAIDSQIAAEQAKLRTQRGSPASTPGGLSRSSSRARNGASPSNEVQKDPAEFEDSDAATPSTSGTPARVGTPVQGEAVTADPLGATGVVADDGKEKEKDDKEKPVDAGVGEKAAVTPATSTNRPAASLASTPDLPTEVRVKLRKLEKIEGKYAGM